MQTYVRYYAYLDTKYDKYVLSFDNDRYTNHSKEPNTKTHFPPEDSFGVMIATRNIAHGEELTCDYYEFDGEAEWKLKNHSYLN